MMANKLTLLTALLFVATNLAIAGSGRFNKAYCMHGKQWGDANFWSYVNNNGIIRVAQLTTWNTSGTFYLFVNNTGQRYGQFALTDVPTNVSVDMACQPRSLPSYSGVAFGSYSTDPQVPVLWGRGQIGDKTKQPRCWWVRCNTDESRVDMCGSQGAPPCTDRTQANFNRYTAPIDSPPPFVDQGCYPISLDSQVDATHEVDFGVQFVDGLWPPSMSSVVVDVRRDAVKNSLTPDQEQI